MLRKVFDTQIYRELQRSDPFFDNLLADGRNRGDMDQEIHTRLIKALKSEIADEAAFVARLQKLQGLYLAFKHEHPELKITPTTDLMLRTIKLNLDQLEFGLDTRALPR